MVINTSKKKKIMIDLKINNLRDVLVSMAENEVKIRMRDAFGQLPMEKSLRVYTGEQLQIESSENPITLSIELEKVRDKIIDDRLVLGLEVSLMLKFKLECC